MATIGYSGRGLYRVATYTRRLRLLARLRDQGATDGNVVIAMGEARCIVVFVLGEIDVAERLYARAFGSIKGYV